MHHIMEQSYHGSLVSRTCALQTERHDIIGISSPIGSEWCLGPILFNHLDLIITREPIHKGEECVGHGVFNQSINMWQGKIILQASPIQVSIINTHAHFPIFLRHGDNICNLIKVGYGSKKTNTQLLFYFFFNLQNNLRFHPTEGLPHWRAFGLNWNPVNNNLYI